jgi:hypothetical protein
MNDRIPLGKVSNLRVTAQPSAAAGFLLLWAVFSLLGAKLFRLKPGAAATGGLLAAALHFVAEMWHQLGHARAAEKTGYPMEGVHLWGVLGTSVYPNGEPELPAEVHVERALGGPRASAVLTVAAGISAALVRPFSRLAFMVASIFALENSLIFTIGAFLPLPFMETDGTTLQRYRAEHRKRMVIIQE